MTADTPDSTVSTVWEQRHLAYYKEFIQSVLDWEPDFIVPVARKTCKLFSSLEELFEGVKERIFYKEYFEFMDTSLEGKKVAIVDDAVHRASALRGYRDFFEQRGLPADGVRTYGFIGHQQLLDDPSLACDTQALVFQYLPPAAYQEYLIQQSYHLILKGAHQDIDHLVLDVEVPEVGNADIENLWGFLEQMGYLYELESLPGVRRCGIHGPRFFSMDHVVSRLGLPIERDLVEKIRFTYIAGQHRLLCTPMVFPRLNLRLGDACVLGTSTGPGVPPGLVCRLRSEHKVDKLCYMGVCLLINSLLARKMLLTVKEECAKLYGLFAKLEVKHGDLVRYLGNDIGQQTSAEIEGFIKQDSDPLDDLIRNGDGLDPGLLVCSLPFSKNSVPAILEHLRVGYETAVQENKGNPVDISYREPVENLLHIASGTHPLMFTEVLDELCDLGVIVPMTDFAARDQCWRRVYRTGEGSHDSLPWERSKMIIPIAIQNLSPGWLVGRMYLEKAMANLCYDFPCLTDEASENHSELHCFVPQPYLWGTRNLIRHPATGKVITLCPADLRDDEDRRLWDRFAQLFTYDEAKNKFYVARGTSLKGVSDLFDGQCRVDELVLTQYFRLLAQVARAFQGDVEKLNQLALCRDKDWFYKHLMTNIYGWTESYKAFLDWLSSGCIDEPRLKSAGKNATSARRKVGFARDFLSDYRQYKEAVELDPVSFEGVWNHHIEPNICLSHHPLLQNPEIKEALPVAIGISLLDGITRLKLGALRQRDTREVSNHVREVGSQALSVMGIDGGDLDALCAPVQECTAAYQPLKGCFDRLHKEIIGLPPPGDDVVEILSQQEYRRARRFDGVANRVGTSTLGAKAALDMFGRELGETTLRLDEYLEVERGDHVIVVSNFLSDKWSAIVKANGELERIKRIP